MHMTFYFSSNGDGCMTENSHHINYNLTYCGANYIDVNILQMRQEICRYLLISRPINLETEYNVQQKATHRRHISGQTWSVEQSYKEQFLSSVKIW